MQRRKGIKIKLVPYVGKTNENTITSFVLPRFISSDKYLYNVDNEYNGVITEAAFADKQFFSAAKEQEAMQQEVQFSPIFLQLVWLQV